MSVKVRRTVSIWESSTRRRRSSMVSIPGICIRRRRSSAAGSCAEMKTFRTRQVQETKMRECATVAAVFDTGPGEFGVEIIAAIDIDSARGGAGCQCFAARGVLGPDGSRETVGAVVHEADAFILGIYGHDADHRPEALLHHDAHGVVHIVKHGGLEEVAGAGRAFAAGEYLGAAVNGLIDLK